MSANLARSQITRLKPYSAAHQQQETTRLNANEVPWENGKDASIEALQHHLNRYPQVRPWQLRDRLADHYGVLPQQLLVTRGSSEAIDLLVRVFCSPSEDNVIVTPPTFGMYRVYADIQQAEVRPIILQAREDFQLNPAQVAAAADAHTKIVFLCSPNNPTGNSFSAVNLESILENRHGQSLVVVDEAYIEFSQNASVIRLLTGHDNLVVLRTMSKAHGLAAARIGTVIASPAIIDLIDSVMAPYAISTPVIELGLNALSDTNLENTSERIDELLLERNRVVRSLANSTAVLRVWQSDANFVLARFRNIAKLLHVLKRHKILIRDFSGEPELDNCARITIGSRTENDQLLDVLRQMERDL
jgi:histidinol-phosphate aminotransferase